MKNVTILGTEYEVMADLMPTCSGCMFQVGVSEHPRRRALCEAAPCTKSRPGNDGRGSFIVVREAPSAVPVVSPTRIDVDHPPVAADPTPGTPPVLRPPQPGESVPGRKDDSGKLDMTLLDDMPRAIKAVVQVMQWAITDKKPVPYERGSWLGVQADRYRAAIGRHMRDAAEQASEDQAPARQQRDKETELLHLAHVATSALMALENVLREQEVKNADE